ncbi:MAG TPA: LCP family protein [Candidatus Dormibacteraeota bacterium]|nr:LCP family protein [Candidatus Dormibacteraeota bacterium]
MRAIRWAALGVAAAVVFAGGVAAAVLHSVAPRSGAAEVAALVIPELPSPGSISWKIAHDQRVNVLLLAYGGSGGDDPNYTDTILVLSIRPHPLTATVLSLPRHLRVDIPAPVRGTISALLYATYSFGKAQDSRFLRSRWLTATGPGDLVAETVSETIDQPIDGWVALDEDAFAAIIDALGGVRLNVPAALDDSQYPVEGSNRTMHVHFDPGAQTMDGTRALEYARSRLSTSETDRAARQELVLVAMLQSLHRFHPGLDVVTAVGPISSGVRTNLVPADAHNLASVTAGIDFSRVNRVRLEDSGLLETDFEGPLETLVPIAGNFDPIRSYVAAQLP